MEIAAEIGSHIGRDTAFTSLLPLVSAKRRPVLYEKAVSAARSSADGTGNASKILALFDLVPFTEEDRRRDLAQEISSEVMANRDATTLIEAMSRTEMHAGWLR